MALKHLEGLPVSIVSPLDVSRLIRELEGLEANLQQLTLQKKELKLPKTSKLLDETIAFNKLDLLQKSDRDSFRELLQAVKEHAPLLHVSFNADPSPVFLAKLMTWLRQNIHPLVLVTIGLQPNIGAGCIIRTTNKYFDFSLGKRFEKNRTLLMEKLREEVVPKPQPAAEPAGAAA